RRSLARTHSTRRRSWTPSPGPTTTSPRAASAPKSPRQGRHSPTRGASSAASPTVSARTTTNGANLAPPLNLSSHISHSGRRPVLGVRGRWEAIRVRLATWNVNSVKARLPRLLEWLDEAKPDIVCLQEIKTTSALFPEAEVNELGYEVAAHGDGRWNGVALLSSVGLDDVSLGFPGQPSYAGEEAELTLIDEPDLRKPEARAVGASCGGIRVWSLYVPNGRTPE